MQFASKTHGTRTCMPAMAIRGTLLVRTMHTQKQILKGDMQKIPFHHDAENNWTSCHHKRKICQAMFCACVRARALRKSKRTRSLVSEAILNAFLMKTPCMGCTTKVPGMESASSRTKFFFFADENGFTAWRNTWHTNMQLWTSENLQEETNNCNFNSLWIIWFWKHKTNVSPPALDLSPILRGMNWHVRMQNKDVEVQDDTKPLLKEYLSFFKT